MSFLPSQEELVTRLAPIIQQMVSSSIQETIAVSTPVASPVPGTVVDVDGAYATVVMDDGGVSDTSTPGQIECIRMTGVVIDSRVRVHFFPDGSAEAHRVVDPT